MTTQLTNIQIKASDSFFILRLLEEEIYMGARYTVKGSKLNFTQMHILDEDDCPLPKSEITDELITKFAHHSHLAIYAILAKYPNVDTMDLTVIELILKGNSPLSNIKDFSKVTVENTDELKLS